MASQRANWSASFRSWLVNAVLAFFFFDATDASFRLYFAALALLVAARICCVGSRDVGRMAVRGVVRLRAERQYLGVAIVNHCLFACLMRSFLARRKKVEFKRDFPRESSTRRHESAAFQRQYNYLWESLSLLLFQVCSAKSSVCRALTLKTTPSFKGYLSTLFPLQALSSSKRYVPEKQS